MHKIGVGSLLVTKNNPDEIYKVKSVSDFNVLIVYAKPHSWGTGWNYSPREIPEIFEVYVPYNNIWCELNG